MAQNKVRVSVGSLTLLTISDPLDQKEYFAFERRATGSSERGRKTWSTKSVPFGGAIKIKDKSALVDLIGDFDFDSDESRENNDFRIIVDRRKWKKIKIFCERSISQNNKRVIDFDPFDEIKEEIWKPTKIEVTRKKLSTKRIGTFANDFPVPTENINTPGKQTYRFYCLYNTRVVDQQLAKKLLKHADLRMDKECGFTAIKSRRTKGDGRYNSILMVGKKEFEEFISSQAQKEIKSGFHYKNFWMAGNVATLFKL